MSLSEVDVHSNKIPTMFTTTILSSIVFQISFKCNIISVYLHQYIMRY